MLTEITVRYIHEEEAGYGRDAGLCLKELECRKDRVACGVACTGNGAVSITALAHEACIVHVIGVHLLLSLLGCDALLLCVSDESSCLFLGETLLLCLLLSCSYHGVNTAELNELVDIFLLVGIVKRINDRCACDIKTFGVLSDLVGCTDNDKICHVCLKDLLGSLKSSLVH